MDAEGLSNVLVLQLNSALQCPCAMLNAVTPAMQKLEMVSQEWSPSVRFLREKISSSTC